MKLASVQRPTEECPERRLQFAAARVGHRPFFRLGMATEASGRYGQVLAAFCIALCMGVERQHGNRS